MPNPFKRTQYIVAAAMVGRINAAHQATDPASKAELLLAAREEAQRHYKKIENRQGDLALGNMLGTFTGLGLLLAGITGTAAVLASPLFLAGAAVTAICAGSMYGLGKATDALRADRDAIDAKIMQDVKTISDAAPEETQKSVRYSKSLSSFFNIKADPATDAAYAKVSSRYMRKASSSTSAPYYHDIH